MSNCRVSEDLITYLEAQAQDEELAWDSEQIETETCEVCQHNVPVECFTYETICDSCADQGTMFSGNLFQSEDMQLYAV